MSNLGGFGLSSPRRLVRDDAQSAHLVVQHPLRRVLAFRGRSIDDVVNDPVIKSEIFGYFKLQKQIERTSEILDLEHQWNPLR
jgi:hypothetical protein